MFPTTLYWNRALGEFYGHIPPELPAINQYLPMPKFGPLLGSTIASLVMVMPSSLRGKATNHVSLTELDARRAQYALPSRML